MLGFNLRLGQPARQAPVRAFNALTTALFRNGEVGFAYDHNDFSTLFQDAAGTIPVTAADQPVGLQLDKSRGLVLGPELKGNLSTTFYDAPSDTYTITRVDGTVQSVVLSAPAGTYLVSVQVLSGSLIAVRTDNTLTQFTVTAGNTVTGRITHTSGELRINNTSDGSTVFRVLTLRSIHGKHRFQTAAASRPMLRNSPRRIDYDAVDDSLLTNFPASLGSACTVVRSVPGVGAQILTAQTIGTSYTDNVDNCGLLVINRALTAAETANITRIFNQLAGV